MPNAIEACARNGKTGQNASGSHRPRWVRGIIVRYFCKYVPPRDLHEIDAELKQVEAEIAALLAEVAE